MELLLRVASKAGHGVLLSDKPDAEHRETVLHTIHVT